MLCELKPRTSEQLIATLQGYHDNHHACVECGRDMDHVGLRQFLNDATEREFM